jgi:putative membrane-bound dehydrogenase-like protein
MRLHYPALLGLVLFVPIAAVADTGVLPTDAKGRPLNLDFESGTLKDWQTEGEAFVGQPIEGDTVARRRGDMKSGHAGRFWVGTFERQGDEPRGRLTSVPFVVTKPFATFLVAGGSAPSSRVEIVGREDEKVIARVTGDDTEVLKRVLVDLTPYVGREVIVRLVDESSSGWGHINFDDFRLHDAKPDFPVRAEAGTPDLYTHAGLSPVEASKAMTLPPGFEVKLFAGEPDVVQPIAFALDDRGRVWVAEAYSYPHRVSPEQAKDRILIFEDVDGDGHFDKKTVFVDKLNLVSGLEIGFGGVWVGAAPELLFIPDQDGDDRPDGPPQVLLDGWGQHDTHETLNSFNWGPDGWLYGCHGVFTYSLVGKPGTPEKDRVPLNAAIWRYHPTQHRLEVFAHGTSNPWGVDFNDRGQTFLTSCVIPHLYHVIQGGRYERQAGQHFNPYTYDDIKTIADHRHWVGANPHAGNGRSDAAGGGHAHSGAMIYLGGAWPAEYRDSIFMNNIHGARLNRDVLVPKGSGFVGTHAPDFLLANDSWSQIINFRYGPDGQVTMIDWYDKNQCHRIEDEVHDRTNGRIFKIVYRGDKNPPKTVNLQAESDLALADMVASQNDWYVRHARRILQERAPRMDPQGRDEIRKRLETRLFTSDRETESLRALWALHVLGALDRSTLSKVWQAKSPYVRAWGIQLGSGLGAPLTPDLPAEFAAMAKGDPSPVVRLYLSSALQRTTLGHRWEVLEGLLSHAEDAQDPNLPLMYWYAMEPLATEDAARALNLALGSSLPLVRSFMVRRIAALGTDESLALLVNAIGRAQDPSLQLMVLTEMNEALKGRREAAMPAAWPRFFARLASAADPRLRSQATTLALTFGDSSARDTLRAVLADAHSDLARRQEALASLLKVRDPALAPTLQALVANPELRGPALRGLASYDDPKTPAILLKIYSSLTPAERRDALNTLAARREYARALLLAVGTKTVPATDLSADLVRQLRNHKDSEIDAAITKVWGTARDTTEDKAKLIAQYKKRLTAGYQQAPDASLGRAVFAKTCQQCHVLFGTGSKVGPELTGSNRADLDYVLSNVLDPSALIGKDYLAHTIATTDGRVLTGLIRSEDKDAITLITANETITLPKGDIEERRPSDQSMMPDDLWKTLSVHEIRSLLRYLASPAQVPMLATRDNAAGFFNGSDLSGWQGNMDLWTVENGEIVGRTSGLARNEFLRSELAADDFRLTVKVKLVKNEGNSGIQFRSEALPDGEMRGYQADVGPGWWGKLYEENGRGLLWDHEAKIHSGDWNTYEIIARGGKIRTSLNGAPAVDLDDPAGARRGIFAFQLHSGGATEVRFKDIHLEVPATQ